MHIMNITNNDLNDYFDKQVKLNKITTENVKAHVFPIVDRLLKYVHEKDTRFGRHPIKTGSAFQELQTKQADEFDFMVPLLGLGSFRWTNAGKRYYDEKFVATNIPLPNPPPGYCFVHVGSKQEAASIIADDLEFEEDLIPFLVQRRLKKLILHAIRCLGMRDVIKLSKKQSGPALTLRIPYNRDGIDKISIDIAAAIPASLSFPSHVRWPPRTRTMWPLKEKIHKIKSIGINFTAKKVLYWLYSFALCENEIMRGIDHDGGCRKKALRIMKRLQRQYWCDGVNKPKISSYILKNILLWECEKHPYSTEWVPGRLAKRINSMIKSLLKCISQHRVDHYFHPDINLLSVKDIESKQSLEMERFKIEEFMSIPSRFLRSQSHQYRKFNIHQNLFKPSNKSFLDLQSF